MRAIQAYSKSSSFVVSFLLIGLLMLGVGFNTYTLSVSNDELLIRETQAAIQADIGGYRSLYNSGGRAAVSKALQARINTPTNDFLYFFKTKQEDFIAGNLSHWPNKNISSIKNGLLEIEVTLRSQLSGEGPINQSESQRAIAMVIEFNNRDSLLVARSLQDIEFAVKLAKTSSWVMIAILCIVAVGSLSVAYYVVSRINKISDKADDIIRTGDLSDRLEVDSNWDDLSKLTLVLNQLLEKIDTSVRAISSVSDNIAHDLRTPLTRLKGHIEALQDQEAKHDLVDECDTLMGIFNALLRISDIENGAKKAGFTSIALNDVLDDAVDLYAPLSEAKGIQLIYKAETTDYITADKDLLFQAFANVLDNAIKFTPEHGLIDISLKQQKQAIVLTIVDSGTGVNKESLAKLTRRFFREEKSRTTSGNGLGLALVQAIVTLHDGEIVFSASTLSTQSGLKCEITLPLR